MAGPGFTNNSVNVAGTNGVGANGGGGGIKDANGQDVIVDKEILEGLLDENQALKDEASKNKVVLDFLTQVIMKKKEKESIANVH